ncbi:MAG: LysM peptidoglycan-binding domain-containing protein, partial [Pseudomonadales bacterium]
MKYTGLSHLTEAVVKQVISPVLLTLFLLFPLSVAAASAEFPLPDNLRPAVTFWTKVYTEAGTNSGFLHDSQDLSIIYRKLNRDRNTINSTREDISEDLKVLATGKRSGLTPSQQTLLNLWGTDTSNSRLEKAASNIRWQLGQSDRFIAGMKRSGAYRNHIETVIREKGLPVELATVPHVESSYHPGAYSSAAASGMWQFVRATAQRFMQVDYVVDQRLDPYTATYGAMELLEYNFNALGTWPLALTAYNHGANGIARAVRDVGTTDIGRIIAEYHGPRFGFASRNFYPQFLAAMEVDRRADEFFGSLSLDIAPDFQSYELDAYINVSDLAEVLGVSTNALKRDNPALQPSVWSGTKRIPKGYSLKIDRLAFNGNLMSWINSISASRLYGDQIPDVSYIVSRGDSLSVIAERYDTSVSELVAINQLRNRNSIRIGQTLLLPQSDGSVPTLVVNTDGPQSMPATGRYEVRRGDSVSLIADRYRISAESVIALNNLNNRGTIFPGQILQLQESSEVTVAVADLGNVLEDTDLSNESLQLNTEDEAINAGDPVQAAQILEVNSNAVALEASADVEDQQLLADLQSDPSDFTVLADNTIEIQAAETLGHFAEWLGIRAWDIRRLNNMVFSQPVIIGERLILDFSKVDKQKFEQER